MEISVLNNESREVLLQVIRTLKEQQEIIKKMEKAGWAIYDKIPEALQSSSRYDKLDCSNWTLGCASSEIESAILDIKSVIS